MKKKFLSGSLFLLTILSLFSFSISVKAAQDYGKITVLSEGSSDVVGNESANVTVKYTAGSLKWYPKAPELNRNFDGYWIGIRIDAPTNRNKEAKYQRGGQSVRFEDVKDGSDYVMAWFGVTAERLKEVKAAGEPYNIITYEFDWDADGQFDDQTVTVQIDPDKITLEEVPATHAKVTINSVVGTRVFTVEKNKSLNEYLSTDEKNALNKLLTAPKGQKFVGLFNGEKKFSLDDEVTANITLTALFEDIPEKDTSPKTGVNDYLGLVMIISLLSMTGLITIKKTF